MAPTYSIQIGPVPVEQFDGEAMRAAQPALASADPATREQIEAALASVAAMVECGVFGTERVGATIAGSALPNNSFDDGVDPPTLTLSAVGYRNVGELERQVQEDTLLGVPASGPSETWDI